MPQLPSTRFTASGGPIGASTLNAAINPLIGVINYHTHDANDSLGGYGGPIPQWGPGLGTFYTNTGPGSATWNNTLVAALTAIPADPNETWISPATSMSANLGIGGELQKIRGVIATLLGQPSGGSWVPATIGQFLQYNAGTTNLTIAGTLTANTLATTVAPGTSPINLNGNTTLVQNLTAQYLGDTYGNHYIVSTLPGGIVYAPGAFTAGPTATGTGPFTVTSYVTYSYSGANGPGNPYTLSGGGYPSVVPATAGNDLQATVALNNTNITSVQFFADIVNPPKQVGTVALSYSAGTWSITSGPSNTGGGALVGITASISGTGTTATLTLTATTLPGTSAPVASNPLINGATSPFILTTDASGYLDQNYIVTDNQPFSTTVATPITLADDLQNIRNVLYNWSLAANSSSNNWSTVPTGVVTSLAVINGTPVTGDTIFKGSGGIVISETGGTFTVDGSGVSGSGTGGSGSGDLLMSDFFKDTVASGLVPSAGTGLTPSVTSGFAYIGGYRTSYDGSYTPPATTASTTQYLDWNGTAFAYSTATSPASGYIRLAQVVAGATAITSVTNIEPMGLNTFDNFSASGILTATGGITTKALAGAPTDASFTSTPGDGTLAVNTTSNSIFARSNGTWYSTGTVTQVTSNVVPLTFATNTTTPVLNLATANVISNTFLAGPSASGNGAATMRTIAAADIASVNASALSGIVPLANLSGITGAQLTVSAPTAAQIGGLTTTNLSATAGIVKGQLAVSAPTASQIGGLTTANLTTTAGIVGGQLAVSAPTAAQIGGLTTANLSATAGIVSGQLSVSGPTAAQIGGLTNANLSGTAGITAANIASVNPSALTGTGIVPPASFATGVATGNVPQWNATTLTWGWVTPGSSSATVSSVGLALPTIFTVTGSPVTTSGTLTGSLAAQTASAAFIGPVPGGAAAAPTFRALVAGDIPAVNPSALTGTGIVPPASFATGVAGGNVPQWNASTLTWDWLTPGSSTATVSSVALALPSIFTVTGSPVTSTGTLTGALATQNPNILFAGPASGAAVAPTFRALVTGDIGAILTNANLTGTAGITAANIASIGLSAIPEGTVVGQLLTTSSTTAAPTWGLIQPTSFTATAPAATGYVPTWNTSTSTWSFSQNGAGSVTSVGLALPSIFSVTGSPVTGSGTLTGSLVTQTASTVFVGPAPGGVAAAPTFRALVAGDIPSINLSAIPQAATLNYVLTTTSTTAAPTWAALPASGTGTVTSVAGNPPLTITGTATTTPTVNLNGDATVGHVLLTTTASAAATWGYITNSNLSGTAGITSANLMGSGTAGQFLKTTTINAAPTWTGLVAGDITAVNPSTLTGTGTVPLVAISGLTNTQLSGTAGITAANIASIALSAIPEGTAIGQVLKTTSTTAAPTWAVVNASDIGASGNLGIGTGTITSGAITSSGVVQGTTLTSTIAAGTAPLTVTSNTVIPNLNASLLGGLASTAFVQSLGWAASSTGTVTAVGPTSTGQVQLIEGSNITLSSSGSQITIASTGGSTAITPLLFPDYFSSSITSGLTITGTTTTTFTGTLNTGVAYINNGTSQGRYSLTTAQALTFGASLDTYVDWNGTSVALATVANNGAVPAVTANSIRLAKVVTGTGGVSSVQNDYTTIGLSTTTPISTGAITANGITSNSVVTANSGLNVYATSSTGTALASGYGATINFHTDGGGNAYSAGTVGAQVFAANGLTGAISASRYAGGTTSGHPTTGTFALGDFVIAQNAAIFICTVAGSPGTWVQAGGVAKVAVGAFNVNCNGTTSVATSVNYTSAGFTTNPVLTAIQNSNAGPVAGIDFSYTVGGTGAGTIYVTAPSGYTGSLTVAWVASGT